MSVSYSYSTGLSGELDVAREDDDSAALTADSSADVGNPSLAATSGTDLPNSSAALDGVTLSRQRRAADRSAHRSGWTQHWFWAEGCAFDWALAALLLAASAIPYRLVLPVTRHVTPNDPALSYPHAAPGTVSSPALYTAVLLGPLLLFSVTQLWLRSLKDWHHGLLSLAEALALSFNFKRWLNLVGRYRPDLLARQAAGIDGGDMAYPSGHAAYSFCAATVMMLYIWGKLQVFSSASATGRLGKVPLFSRAVLGLLPVVGAGFIAATRLTDYRHDFSDVNMGSAIGIICGSIGYFLNFPSLFDPGSWQVRRRAHGGGSHREAVQDTSWTTGSSDETDLMGAAAHHRPQTVSGVGEVMCVPNGLLARPQATASEGADTSGAAHQLIA